MRGQGAYFWCMFDYLFGETDTFDLNYYIFLINQPTSKKLQLFGFLPFSHVQIAFIELLPCNLQKVFFLWNFSSIMISNFIGSFCHQPLFFDVSPLLISLSYYCDYFQCLSNRQALPIGNIPTHHSKHSNYWFHSQTKTSLRAVLLELGRILSKAVVLCVVDRNFSKEPFW